jgi:excisionase family DNA binding protein
MWAVPEPRQRPSPPVLMTISQLAEHLKVDTSGVYKLLRNDHLPYVKIGGDIRFDRHEIDRWIAHRKVKD